MVVTRNTRCTQQLGSVLQQSHLRISIAAALLSAASCGAFFFAAITDACAQDETPNTDQDVLFVDPTLTEDSLEVHDDASTITDDLVSSVVVSAQSSSAATSLADVLRTSSVLHVSDSGGRLQRQTVSLHGSASQDVLVTFHDIPINALSHASADLSLIPARLLESASVRTNAGSERAGSGGLGGVIELNPTHASHDIELAASAGTLEDFAFFGQKPITTANTSTEFAAFADRTSGKFDYIDAQDEIQTRNHNGAWRLGSLLDFAASTDKAQLEAFLFGAYLEREVAGLSEFPDAFKQANESSLLTLVGLKTAFSPVEVGSSTASFALNANHRYARNHYDNPTGFMGGRPVDALYNENRAFLESAVSFDYANQYSTQIALSYEAQSVGTESLIMGNRVEDEHKRHIITLRAEQNMSWFDEQLRLFAGLRIDEIVYSGQAYSPRIALNYHPVSWFDINASVSYANRFPSFDELYINTESIQGDKNLNMQKSVLNELLLSFNFAPWLEMNITGFYNIHWDLIRFIPVSAILYRAQNLSRSTARGVDLNLKSNIYDYVELSFGYTFNDSFVDEGELPIPGIARHHITARAAGFWQNLEVWVQASYTAKIAQKLSGQYAQHDPFRLDAHVGYTLLDMFKFTVDVQNLTNDRKSQDFRQYPLPGTTAMFGLEIVR